MIHFVARFSKDAANTPLGDALRASGVPHRIFGLYVPQAYRRRIQLLLLGYPRLAAAAARTAWSSLIRARPRPGVVIISSDVEALVFALVRLLPGAARPAIVLAPFIFTPRASGLQNRLRRLYYRAVLRAVAVAICHSRLEVARYVALFPGRTRFTYVPWGTHVPPAAAILAATGPTSPPPRPLVVSAGRSGRDYPLLVRAMAGLDAKLLLICNEVAALHGVQPSSQVEILDRCFGLDYLRHLMQADIVVVPLRVDDISAGQMVFIQAMSLARPLIVTRTATVEDYLRPDQEALLVPIGDEAALRAALRRLLNHPDQGAALGARAQARYQSCFSNEAYLRALVAAVDPSPNPTRGAL